MRGLFSLIAIITSFILLSSWTIINYQVEQLVAQRTSEYAHSIAQIAANSSADALLSDDKIQLKMLVENVAKDPYIRSATIFAEDGQVIARFPEDNTLSETSDHSAKNIDSSDPLPTNSKEKSSEAEIKQASTENDQPKKTQISKQALEAATQSYIQSQSDIPFIEKITYQDVTAGWFKITLNRQLLESSFRKSLQRSQVIILTIAAVLLLILLVITFRYNRRVKNLISLCHRLIQINAPQLPKDNKQWLESLEELSKTQFQSLSENIHLPSDTPQWTASRRANDSIFCFCQFAMIEQDNEKTAHSLTLAEQYLKAAVQTHGVQSQGEILSGCLIPFLDSNDENEALEEAINLVYLIKELLASITLEIKVRAFIGKGTILVLENERAVITGVSLSNRLHQKINQLTLQTNFGEVICIGFEQNNLTPFGQFIEKQTKDESDPTIFHLLESVDESIKQQTGRQINYIITNYCDT